MSKFEASMNEVLEKLKNLKRALSKMGLFLFFAVYTVTGAKIFQVLEHPSEVRRQYESGVRLIEARKHFLSELLNLTVDTEEMSIVSANLRRYEEVIEMAKKVGISALEPEVPHYKWNFIESIFFASTVITTIGYGNVAPSTSGGRGFCILYAFIGIPVTLSVIADLGAFFANLVSKLHDKIHKRIRSLRRKKVRFEDEDEGFGEKTKRALIVAGSIMALLLYLAVGARLFISWENWTFFEAFYFCFITMTTIGLGDLVPERTEFMLVCTLYILIGLALTSTIIELIRRQYAESWKQMKELSSKLGGLSGPLAEQLKKLGHTDLSLDINLNSELKELRNALQLSRLEALYRLDPRWRNDNALSDILRSHFGLGQEKEESEQDNQSEKIFQLIIYESSV